MVSRRVSVMRFKSPRGYVITTVKKCKCKNCQPILSDNGPKCINCGASLKVVNLDTFFETMEDLYNNLPESRDVVKLRDNNEMLKVQLGKADLEIRNQNSRIADLEKKLADATTIRDAYMERCGIFERDLNDKTRRLDEAISQIDSVSIRCRELEGKISESDVKLEDIESGYRSEVERLHVLLSNERKEKEKFRVESESLTDTIRHLDQEVKDLRDTNNHSRLEVQRMESLDVRGLVSSVMVYAAAINNTVNDGVDLDSIRTLVDARTSKLMMDLNSNGVTVTRHHSGDLLKDGRVDVSKIITDDPENDMRVVRSNSYGASFRNDLYPAIPESVSVYEFVKSENRKEMETQ